MSNLTWLFIAFSVVWLALGLYLYSLGARQRALERRLSDIAGAVAKRSGAPHPME